MSVDPILFTVEHVLEFSFGKLLLGSNGCFVFGAMSASSEDDNVKTRRIILK